MAVVPGVPHGLLRRLHRVPGAPLEHRGPGLLPHHLELLYSRRPVHVAGRKQGPMPLAFQHIGKLRRVGGLARALQSAQHYHRRGMGRAFEPLLAAAHKGGQLLVDYFYHHLGRGQALHDLLAYGTLRYLPGELLCHLIVHVGL